MVKKSAPDMKIDKALLLIIAYKRLGNVYDILKVAQSAGVTRSLIHIDKAKKDDPTTAAHQLTFLQELGNNPVGLEIEVKVTDKNVGCAVNVLTGIDAAFQSSEFCFILEDDCIPTIDFFRFAIESQSYLSSDQNVWLTCGTQFLPAQLTNGKSIYSSFALTWGWYTDARKWLEIREALFSKRQGPWSGASLVERRYWKAGRRRALRGITDVWDTILVSKMREFGKKSILPPESLVKNVGDDEAATHTVAGSEWLHLKTGHFTSPIELANPKLNKVADDWIARNVFRISYRHIVSTSISQLLDLFHLRQRRFTESLITRVERRTSPLK